MATEMRFEGPGSALKTLECLNAFKAFITCKSNMIKRELVYKEQWDILNQIVEYFMSPAIQSIIIYFIQLTAYLRYIAHIF